MENKGIERAKEYSKGKSSSDVFRRAHEQDYVAGYNQALQDVYASEMLEMLKDILSGLKGENFEISAHEIEDLLKKINN